GIVPGEYVRWPGSRWRRGRRRIRSSRGQVVGTSGTRGGSFHVFFNVISERPPLLCKEGNTLSVTFVTVITSGPANVGPPTSQAEPRYCRKPCSRYPRPEERGLSPIPAECILGGLSRSDWRP